MKTKYQFIHFVEAGIEYDKPVYSCRNNKTNGEIGLVGWYTTWRMYCFSPTIDTIYSASCLQDLQDFIEQLTEDISHERAIL